MEKELTGRSQPEGNGQGLDVKMELCDKCCPSGPYQYQRYLIYSSMT